ncbi:Delta(8)-fatty-acid desaturase [Quillaja saponaria]|uniref:Delta(8)-fatty-acid desaturase n=1 Tax=Quillaja saponaria TaxID=32244 RepID=A0AAD7LQH8_QUISA|nr:Delta(8)-fatty-acid desaturase [Quillaja saponaria]
MEVEKKYITSEELKEHNKAGDLWISIQGKVYNVSDWIKVHPGGDTPLLNLAGQDATDAFLAYHPGTAWKYLDKLFTGYYLKDFVVSEVSKDYRKLATEFSKMGLYEKKGHGVFYSLTSVAIMLSIVVYGVLKSDSVWVHLACGMLLGFLWIQSAYVGHDSGHYQVMCSRGYNKFAQFLAGNCLTGISIAWWKWTHNAHHLAVNSLDHDPDLQHIPVFAVSTSLFKSLTSQFYGRELTFDAVARFFVSYQHLTFYPVMCVGRINLFIQTFLLLFSTRKVPDRALNILGIIVFWTWFPLLVSYLPNWPERFMFVLASFVVTSIQHIQFCLNHFSADVYVGKPTGSDWFEKQTGGTIDIACSSWMDWFHGGLQFQLEHHLFPRLPRCQLRKISPVVRDLCKKHNLPYRSLSFWDANVSTIRTLRTAALQARGLLWEAVNTHG